MCRIKEQRSNILACHNDIFSQKNHNFQNWRSYCLLPHESRTRIIFRKLLIRNPNHDKAVHFQLRIFSHFKHLSVSITANFIFVCQVLFSPPAVGGILCSHSKFFASFKISNNFKFYSQSGDYSWPFRFLIWFCSHGHWVYCGNKGKKTQTRQRTGLRSHRQECSRQTGTAEQ